MNMRITARIVAGAITTALIAMGTLAAPAQAKDTGWPQSSPKDTSTHRIIG